MIKVEHLTKKFGRFTAVDDLSFTVESGEALALWGPNGAGKTTVIRCILGLLPYRGSLAVAGHDVRTAGKAGRRFLGYVPQELALYDDFRVSEMLGFIARIRKADPRNAVKALEEVGLIDHVQKRVRELSGGMKQRLALALALLSEAPLLILDELTSNLDTSARSEFLALLEGLKGRGKTLLFTSHRADEIQALASRVLTLEAGRLVRECAPEELVPATSSRGTLEIFLGGSQLAHAVAILEAHGFVVAPNRGSLLVEVGSQEKVKPIRSLVLADISVRNFEFSAHRGSAGERGVS